MFEEKTFENLMASALSRVSDKLDKRQGSVVYDMIAPAVMEIASYYIDLEYAFKLVFLSTAVGEYLDDRGAEIGLKRNPGVKAVYNFSYEGTRPEEGTRFFYEGLYFTLIENDGTLYLEAETPGAEANSIAAGEKAVPSNNIPGLKRASFSAIYARGADKETDDAYRERLREKLSGPAENGNVQQYKTWCESIPGVGRAKIVPLFAGENTVLGVLFAPDGAPADAEAVAKAQEYVDPITLNKKVVYNGEEVTVGDGLGYGVANIGAHFLARAAKEKAINISFLPTVAEGCTLAELTEQMRRALEEYFRELAFDEAAEVRLTKIGSILLRLDALEDYRYLKLNGAAENVTVAGTETPTLGEITILKDGEAPPETDGDKKP